MCLSVYLPFLPFSLSASLFGWMSCLLSYVASLSMCEWLVMVINEEESIFDILM